MSSRIESKCTITICKTAATAKGKKVVVISLDLPGDANDDGMLGRMVNVTGLQLTLVDPQVDVYYKMMKPGPAGVQAPLPAPVFSGIEGSRTIIETPPEPDVLSDEERAANEAEADWIRDQAESEHEAASGREATESMEDTHDFKHSLPSPSDVDEAAGASMVAPRRRRGGSNIVPLGRRTS